MGKVVSYHRESKPLPNELLLMYRQRSGLTQNQLALYLGLKSDRMVQKWEGGYTLPTALRLQSLIELYMHKSVFVRGKELEEARELWRTVKDMFDLNSANYESYPIFDNHWFQQVTTKLVPPTDQTFTLVQQIKETPNPTRLPVPPNRLVGRQEEVRTLLTYLGRNTQGERNIRLLTLTGAGGTGKTRLAIQVAAQLQTEFEQVWFVSLAGVQDYRLVASTVTVALGLKEQAGTNSVELLQNFLGLGNKQTLLVLDNFEHLLQASSLLATLLENCSRLVIVVTSRIALRLAGEYDFQLAPLKLPPSLARAAKLNDQILELNVQYPAITLFVERAQAVKPSFQIDRTNAGAVIEICQRLDGLPLALELAAAWIKMLSPQFLLARLIDEQTHLKLQMLNTAWAGLPERQKTIFASIDWSYRLLDEAEKTLFLRLAIFSGSWELTAAEEICSGERLAREAILNLLYQLVNHSLVVVADETAGSDEPRYYLLETIKQYAYEKLVRQGEAELFERKHCEYYLSLVEQGELAFTGPAREGRFNQLRYAYPNVTKALSWSLASGEALPSAAAIGAVVEPARLELGARLNIALISFWKGQGLYREGRHWLELWLTCAEGLAGPQWEAHRAKILRAVGFFSYMQGDYETAMAYLEEGFAMFHKLKDKDGIALVLGNMGMVAAARGKLNRMKEYYEVSLQIWRESGDERHLAVMLTHYAMVFLRQGDLDQAQAVLEESLGLSRKSTIQDCAAHALGRLGEVARERGDFEGALKLYSEGLEIYQKLQHVWGIPFMFSRLGELAFLQGQYEQALIYLKESLALFDQQDNGWGRAELLKRLGDVLVAQASYGEAEWHYQQSLLLYEKLGNLPEIADCLVGLAGNYVAKDQLAQATSLLSAAEFFHRQSESPLLPFERSKFDQLVSACRKGLEASSFASLWHKGQQPETSGFSPGR